MDKREAIKIYQADMLIIATALRNLAQDSERNIFDRERAEELRERVLAYGASMCKPATPTERTGEWIEHKYAEEYDGLMQSNFECSKCHDWLREQTNYCPNCGAKMGGDME